MQKPSLAHIHPGNFEEKSLAVFQHQYQHNKVYQQFCKLMRKSPENVNRLTEIPFLPIQFFKTHQITTNPHRVEAVFTSSGTTGSNTSKHYVTDLSLYEESFSSAFQHFYGAIDDFTVLALLPAYLERKGSSLINMVDAFIRQSKYPESGFYLNELNELANTLKTLDQQGRKVLLIGVSFALLDLVEQHSFSLKNTIVMETGGMKGRRKEMIREELHKRLAKGFGVQQIHSEYGMTELLSQAYSKGDGIFQCPPHMQLLIRDPEDPLTLLPDHKNGGINVIDLANYHSCSFIATQDLGKKVAENAYRILGRFDNSDIRGCNLLVL